MLGISSDRSADWAYSLMASFMSGMAGNVNAFNTVWTYDIYQTYSGKSDNHYCGWADGNHCGVVISIGQLM
jgi:hypothetical protein